MGSIQTKKSEIFIIHTLCPGYTPSSKELLSGKLLSQENSLGKDRLGGFNISIKAPGEIPNVARCWTYETGLLLLDIELRSELPQKTHYNFFGPDFFITSKSCFKIWQMLTEESIFRTKVVTFTMLKKLKSQEFWLLWSSKCSNADGINEEFRDAGFRSRKPLYFDGSNDNDRC
ncbi:hypothetical protein C1646_808996 [Rhizophagus diaphanus]|nr:hypothetical protein C1646_808996 [Rhizophagus diaphanus] [Rhizophagus sp. MUCL 43196]